MEPGVRFCGNDWPCTGTTMIGHVRLMNVAFALNSVIADSVPGAFAELGVWRGGACIFARKFLDILGQEQRKVHVFDAFELIHGYGTLAHSMHRRQSFLQVPQGDVVENFRREGALNNDSVAFHKGLFENSVPTFRRAMPPSPSNHIAVLRIDGNFYDSYQDAMYYLYEYVPVGGFVIFDDVRSHPVVMEFWHDFKREQGVSEALVPIDGHSAYFRKTLDVKVDMAKMHPRRGLGRGG